jgi:integral membrane sensor domain MASE1
MMFFSRVAFSHLFCLLVVLLTIRAMHQTQGASVFQCLLCVFMQVAPVYDVSLLSDDEQKVEIILHVRSTYL